MFPEINYLCQTETGAVIWASYSSGGRARALLSVSIFEAEREFLRALEGWGLLSSAIIRCRSHSCNSSLCALWGAKKHKSTHKVMMICNAPVFLLHHCCFTGSEGEKTRMSFEKLLRSLQQVEVSPSALREVFICCFLSAGINLHISIVTHLPPCLYMPRSSGPSYLREAADNNCVDCKPSAPRARCVWVGAGGGVGHVVIISWLC